MRLCAFVVVLLLLAQLSSGVNVADQPVELLPVEASNPIDDVDYMGHSKAAVTEELFGESPRTPLINPQLTLYRVNGVIAGDDTPSQQYLQPGGMNIQQAPVFSNYARNLGKDVDDGSMDVDPADVQRSLRIAGRAETNSLRVAKRVRIYQRRTKNRLNGMDRSNRQFRQRITARANGIDDRVSALNNNVDLFKGQTRSKFDTVDNQVQGLNRAVAGYSVVRDTVIRQGQKIDGTNVRVNGISSQVGVLAASALKARARINALLSQINNINSAAASKGSDTGRRINALKNRIAQLKAAGASAAQLSYSKISSLQSKIRNMRVDSMRYRQQVAKSMQALIKNIRDLRSSIKSVKQSTAAAIARVRKTRGPQGAPGSPGPRGADGAPGKSGDGPLPIVKLNGFQFSPVDVEGAMNSVNILAACKSKGMDTPCDHPAYCDGKCVNTYPDGHLSFNNVGRFPSRVWNEKYFYCGSANGGNSLQSTGNTHRWSDANNQNQQAMCAQKIGDVASSAQKKPIDYEGFTFYPTVIKGIVSNTAILAACQARGLMTPCDRESALLPTRSLLIHDSFGICRSFLGRWQMRCRESSRPHVLCSPQQL